MEPCRHQPPIEPPPSDIAWPKPTGQDNQSGPIHDPGSGVEARARRVELAAELPLGDNDPVDKIESRPSARVIVVDDLGCALLCRVDDPLDNKPPVWLTPGGGVEPDEEAAEAAARELYEETGLQVHADALGDPVAVTRGVWGFRGTRYYSEDWYLGLRTTRYGPVDDGLTALELTLHTEWKWWSPDSLETTPETILPAGISGVVRSIHAGQSAPQPIELPWKLL